MQKKEGKKIRHLSGAGVRLSATEHVQNTLNSVKFVSITNGAYTCVLRKASIQVGLRARLDATEHAHNNLNRAIGATCPHHLW